MGKVKPDSQNRMGGWTFSAQRANWSTRWERSRVHAARGFRDGYAWRTETDVESTLLAVPHNEFNSSVAALDGLLGQK